MEKNTTSIVRGLGEIGSIIIKDLTTDGEITVESGAIATRAGISIGLKTASRVLLPVICFGFANGSFEKINKDCNKILEIFKKVFTPLRFKTLKIYTKTFRKNIQYLELLLKEDEDNNNDNSIEEKKR